MASLTDQDLRRFAHDGYLVIPGVVPEPLPAAADFAHPPVRALPPHPDAEDERR